MSLSRNTVPSASSATNEGDNLPPSSLSASASSLADDMVTQAATEAERMGQDAALVPASFGKGELPAQAAADVVLENATRNDENVATAAVAANSRQVQEKAVSGAKSLGLRTLVSLGLRAVSSLTLSRFLLPHNYGVFGAASGIAGLGQYFCDVGMGSVLVMQEREPTEDEITTIFWLQQFVTTIVVAILLACVPFLLALFKAEQAAAPVLVVMALGLFPASLRVVPVMMLERRLDFGQQAKAEMVENVAQVGVNLAMAVAGFGTWALVGGAITARIVGLIAIWMVAPWRPRGRFQMEVAKKFIGRGSQFQACVIVPVAFGFLYPVIISRELGMSALGFLGWAANLASIPLLLHGILNRIAFPALSRLQSDPDEVGRVTGILVRRVSTTLNLCFAPIVILSPALIPLVFGAKWKPAIPLFQWSIMDTINFIVIALVAAALGGGAGYINLRLVASVVGGVAKVGLLYAAVHLFGLNGAAIGSFVANLCELAVLAYYAKKHITGCGTLNRDILLPLFGLQGTMALGLALSYGVFRHNGVPSETMTHLLSAALALLIFAIGVAMYDFLGARGAVRTEVAGILRLLRARQAA